MNEKELDRWLSNINSSEINLIDGIMSKEEMILDYFIVLLIVKKKSDISTDKLISNPISLDTIDIPNHIKEFINKILDLDIEDIQDNLNVIVSDIDNIIADDILGTWYQHSLTKEYRKVSASNYTLNSDELLKSLSLSYKGINSVSDPFCGSGRLITSIIPLASDLQTVYINDISPTALLIAYLRITTIAPNINIYATIGNAFNFINYSSDIVIINPPFTRSMYISDSIKTSIKKIASLKNQGHAGLHIFSLYLADYLLNPNGILISILPASTLSSTYAKTMQKIILNNYSSISFVQEVGNLSFSQDSEFNEILMHAMKLQNDDPVYFNNIGGNKIGIDKIRLLHDWNWIRYFRNHKLQSKRNKIIDEFSIINGTRIDIKIKRGVELYGADFFFFPNKNYPIINKTESQLELINDPLLNIPDKFIRPVVRQPKLYQNIISPNINEFCLVVPENEDNISDGDLIKYCEKHGEQADVAKKKFGNKWLHHISNQITSKHPIGHLFIVDKADICKVSTIAHYTTEEYICTKNFYLIDEKQKLSKLIAAWMNSTLFLVLYLSSRREINNSYGRMQIIDYKNELLFPKKLRRMDLNSPLVEAIISHFDSFREKILPPLPEQVGMKDKQRLDKMFLELVSSDIDLNELYQVTSDIFKDFAK